MVQFNKNDIVYVKGQSGVEVGIIDDSNVNSSKINYLIRIPQGDGSRLLWFDETHVMEFKLRCPMCGFMPEQVDGRLGQHKLYGETENLCCGSFMPFAIKVGTK
jgi:hypothetical protein